MCVCVCVCVWGVGGEGGGGVGSAFFSLQVHESVEISLVEVFERVGKTVISVCQKVQKGKQMHFIAVKIRATFWFCDLFKLKKSTFIVVTSDTKFYNSHLNGGIICQ